MGEDRVERYPEQCRGEVEIGRSPVAGICFGHQLRLLATDHRQSGLDGADAALRRLRAEASLLEGDQVALQPMLQVDALYSEGRKPTAPGSLLRAPLLIRRVERLPQHRGVGVDLGELAEDRSFELVATQTVLVAGSRAMP
ncbi:MAG: hypothetical protein WEB29_03145 [Chloroflexota bacterium]